MDQIFVAHDSTSSEDLLYTIFPALFKPPSYGVTEDSFHAFWDAIIKLPLELFCQRMEFDRSTHRGTPTGSDRPDFIGRLEGIAIFRGEEKGFENSHEEPDVELISKLDSTWKYEGVPYILAYHAKTRSLTFDAIDAKNRDKAYAISRTYDLKLIEDRFSVFIHLYNISTILPTLAEMCSNKNLLDYVLLVRSTGISIEISKRVWKRYPYKYSQTVKNLVLIYQRIKDVPFVNRLENDPKASARSAGHFTLCLSPVGWHCKPRTLHECVLTALKGLHQLGIIHRDIRWPNVMKYTDRIGWFLIDFDEASTKPTQAATHLNHLNHAPEIMSEGHGEAVDMWGVGLLIAECGISMTDAQIDDLKKNLLSPKPEERYTAMEALEQLAILLGIL